MGADCGGLRIKQRLGRVDKIEIFVIPAFAGIYEDVHQVIIGLKTPGFRFKTGMTGYLSTRPNKIYRIRLGGRRRSRAGGNLEPWQFRPPIRGNNSNRLWPHPAHLVNPCLNHPDNCRCRWMRPCWRRAELTTPAHSVGNNCSAISRVISLA